MNIQLLKFIVVAMGILIVVGTVVLGVTIAGRLKGAPETEPGWSDSISLPLEPGARIVETNLDGERLAVRLDTATGSRILIIDLPSGQVVSTIDASAIPQ